MNVTLAVLWMAAAPPLAPTDAPVFSRPEPNLQAGADALRRGDAEGALASFRKATGKDGNERAVIEFDVGQALLEQAQQDAKAAPEADGGPQKIDVANARAAFDRAFGLAADQALKSEAQLASGNAAALGGDLDGAIAAYRKALVADPKNARAKKNLLRVLAAKKAQPPPPPSEGGDSDDNKDDKDGEQKPDEQKPEPSDDKKDQQKDGEQKPDQGNDDKQDPKDGQGKDGDDKKDEQKDPKDQESQGGDKDDGKKDDKDQKDSKGAEKPQPKQQKKEDARKLLDALRSREKPLSPLEMRGTTKGRAKQGKDW